MNIRNSKIILYFIIVLFLMHACSDSPTQPIEPQYPFLYGANDILIVFSERYISISSKYAVNNASLKIDGVEIALYWENDFLDEEWYSVFKPDTVSPELKYEPGMEITFELIINEYKFFDKIYLSNKPQVEWPNFNPDENFSFTWTMEDIPTQQSIWMYISDHSQSYSRYWQLEGKEREFTISKYYLNKYENDELLFLLNIICFNKVSQGKHVAISEISTDYRN